MEDLRKETKPTIKLNETKPIIKEFAITVTIPLEKPIVSFKDIDTFVNFFSNHMNSDISFFQKSQYKKCIDILSNAKENKAILSKVENIFVKSCDIAVEFTFSFTEIIKLINFVTFLDKKVILYLI